MDNCIENFRVCKISHLLVPHTAGDCLPKEKMGFTFASQTKLGLLTLDTNPVPAELFAAALKENGNLKEVWEKGNQTEYKDMESLIWGRDDEHSCTQSPPPVLPVFTDSCFDSSCSSSCGSSFRESGSNANSMFKWRNQQNYSSGAETASEKSVCSISAINVLFPNSIPRSLKEKKGLIWNAPVYIRILNMQKLFQIIVLLLPGGITLICWDPILLRAAPGAPLPTGSRVTSQLEGPFGASFA